MKNSFNHTIYIFIFSSSSPFDENKRNEEEIEMHFLVFNSFFMEVYLTSKIICIIALLFSIYYVFSFIRGVHFLFLCLPFPASIPYNLCVRIVNAFFYSLVRFFLRNLLRNFNITAIFLIKIFP